MIRLRLICDRCGDVYHGVGSEANTRYQAEQEGWSCRYTARDLCPICATKYAIKPTTTTGGEG